MFQYSFCSYSTIAVRRFCCAIARFQYSFCSYSTLSTTQKGGTERKFQYSFCSYSTQSTPTTVMKPTRVSIQLLFLFNFHYPDRKFALVQFQYSFCSYSTSLFAGIRIPDTCFNTASVLIQPIKKTSCQLFQRFNTASVLIQPSIFQYSL